MKKKIAVLTGVISLIFSNAMTAENPFSAGYNQFALNLYRTLSEEAPDQNVFASPYSIYNALSLAYAGSGDGTRIEFEKALAIKQPERFHADFSDALKSLNERDGQGYNIHTANALWIDINAKILPAYSALIKKYYGTTENKIDVSQPAASADMINSWVAKKTRDKIDKIISPDSITANTRLVITNAVYFKGDWATPFKSNNTRPGEFSSFTGAPVKVPFMHQQKPYKYMVHDGSALIELPYRNGQLSMVFVLPTEKGRAAFTAAEKKLSANLEKFVAAAPQLKEVDVSLPKFKIETPLMMLNTPLEALGIKAAFSSSSADLSGINGTRDLYIALATHKAMINVDEKGTEAAAATALDMELTSVRSAPIRFYADRPFLYLIRDNKTGMILFIGKLLNPV